MNRAYKSQKPSFSTLLKTLHCATRLPINESVGLTLFDSHSVESFVLHFLICLRQLFFKKQTWKRSDFFRPRFLMKKNMKPMWSSSYRVPPSYLKCAKFSWNSFRQRQFLLNSFSPNMKKKISRGRNPEADGSNVPIQKDNLLSFIFI